MNCQSCWSPAKSFFTPRGTAIPARPAKSSAREGVSEWGLWYVVFCQTAFSLPRGWQRWYPLASVIFSIRGVFFPPLVYQIKLFLPTFQTIVAFWVQVWSTVFGDDGRGIRTFLIFQLPYNFRNAVKRLWMLKMINYWFKLSLKRGGSGVGGVELDVKGHANLSVRAQAKQYLSSLPAASVRL